MLLQHPHTCPTRWSFSVIHDSRCSCHHNDAADPHHHTPVLDMPQCCSVPPIHGSLKAMGANLGCVGCPSTSMSVAVPLHLRSHLPSQCADVILALSCQCDQQCRYNWQTQLEPGAHAGTDCIFCWDQMWFLRVQNNSQQTSCSLGWNLIAVHGLDGFVGYVYVNKHGVLWPPPGHWVYSLSAWVIASEFVIPSHKVGHSVWCCAVGSTCCVLLGPDAVASSNCSF